MTAAGLFAGVGGLELGLSRAGHRTRLLCENEPGACAVLRNRFPRIPLHEDIRDLDSLSKNIDIIVAGFPCQDLSQAGATAGINGSRSGLVDQVFRLLETHDVPWVLLENVPFMLQLRKGEALEHIVTALERFGYDWAYRVIDSRSMGLPQRRERVFLLATRVGDPRDVLLVDDAGQPDELPVEEWRRAACGFYWTEGVRGLGWAFDAVPTLKAGSTVGIPSPPAIVLPSGRIVKPDIRDAERMQGFEAGWTKPSEDVVRASHRWRLVGNAVTVDVAEWIGEKLRRLGRYDDSSDVPLIRKGSWPRSAWGIGGERFVSSASRWPVLRRRTPLADFLQYEPAPLSVRATEGFYSRTQKSRLRFPPGFLEIVQDHLRAM